MPSPHPSPIFTLFANIVFPVLLGGMVNCPLFGVTVAQTMWYFYHYPGDSVYLKSWILAVLAVDGVQTLSLLQACKVVYLRARISFAYSGGLVLDLYVSCLTVTMVQGTFTYRVWILSNKNRFVTAALAFLTFCQFSSGIGMSILQQLSGDVNELHSPISNAVGTTEFGSTILCDCLISASLAYYLNRRRSGIRRTENLVDKLIIYVIGIGLLTSIVAVVVFALWLALPDRLIFMTFHGIISKLYVNSLLVTLNARSSLRTPKNALDSNNSIGLSDLSSSSNTAR